MKFTSAVLSGVVGAGAVASAMTFAGAAGAKPGDCTAAEFARTQSTVSAQVATYLDKNPTINDGITNAAKGAAEGQRHEAIKQYLEGQPAAKGELDRIRQPITSLKDRCTSEDQPKANAAPAAWNQGNAPEEQQPAESAPGQQADGVAPEQPAEGAPAEQQGPQNPLDNLLNPQPQPAEQGS